MALPQLPSLTQIETEEERRRRLAAEAVAAGQVPPAEPFRVEVGGVPIYAESPTASTVTPPAGFKLMSSSQVDTKPAGSYYDATLNAWLTPAAEQSTSTVSGSGTGAPQGGPGSAEGPGVLAPIVPEEKSTPVKQTIVTDPVTGRQTMKIEGSVEDLSAANPLTPTVVTPGAAPVAQPTTQPAAMPPAMPVAAPVDPNAQPGRIRPPIQIPAPAAVAPSTGAAPAPVMPQMGTQQEGNQGEQQARDRMAAMAMAPAPAVTTPAPAVTPPAVTTPAPAAAPTTFETALTGAAQDPVALLQLSKNATYTPEQQRVFAVEAQSLLNQQLGQAKGQEQLAQMSENELARLLKSKNEEGSWAKMLLLGYISPELAGREAVKLGLNAQWKTVQTPDGSSALVKVRGDGIPMEGYNAATGARLNAKELVAAAGSGASSLGLVGGTYINDKTGEVGRVVTNEKTGVSYVQTDTGRKPLTGFRPQSTSGSLDQQRVAQIQKQNIDLATDWARLQMRVEGAAPEAANRFLGEFNAKHGTKFGLSSVTGPAPQISLDTGMMVGVPPTGAAPAAVTGGAVPAPAAAAPAPTVQRGPVAPTPAPAAAPATAPAAPAGGAVRPVAPTTGGGGRSPAQIAQGMDIGTTQAKTDIETGAVIKREELKPPAAERGKQSAADVKNQAFADRTYKLIAPINDAIQRSTGSGIGAGLDKAAAFIGSSTEGSKAIAELNMLSYNILANIPRFEGPQSDIDVQMYKQAAGDFNNRTLPVADRLAALDVLVSILKSYDKAGKNDWTYSKGQPGAPATGGNIKIIKREKVQ